MSAFPGGAADKLGNRYEDWWTLHRLADVLHGRALSLRLEPPGIEGAGVEFWVQEPECRWYEQVKNAPAGGSWTVGRLFREGTLAPLGHHVASGGHVRLVLSTSSELQDLADRARATTSADEFSSNLTNDQHVHVGRIATAWEATNDQVWEQLQRVQVEHLPDHALRRLVHSAYELLVQGAPEAVVNELRGWLGNVLHQELTAPMIWAHLNSVGFSRRLLAGDMDVVAALAATVDRNQRRIDLARTDLPQVIHPHKTKLLERLVADDGPQVIVLHGKAGSGKSTVAADAIKELMPLGWFGAVVRMDKVGPDAQTASALGRAFDLDSSPAVLLSGVAEATRGVLLVDQLDAVSTYSGRMPDSYDAVAEVLEQIAPLPNVRAVLVVRTVDLKADPRMRSLLCDKARVEALEVGDLDAEEVRVALSNSGVDVGRLSAITLQLLRVPLNFAVFTRLPIASRTTSYRTLVELYEEYTKQLRLEVETEVGHLDWQAITVPLVTYMSDHERLDAPLAILEGVAQLEVYALLSRGLLVADGGRVGFRHESYFDFLFARTFVHAGRRLHEFLIDAGQFLFRRAQARQVLEYLAGTDRNGFRRTVLELLTSDVIRLHLQDVVITVLGQIDAAPDDWRAIEPLAFGDHRLALRLRDLLTRPSWFDAADAAGRWEVLLEDAGTVDAAMRELIVAARARPERVSALVRPYVGTSVEWQNRLRALVEWSLTPGLVDLTVEVIASGAADEARGPLAVNADFWSLIHRVHTDDPAGAARLVGARLRRCLELAEAAGSSDPFESGHLNAHSSAGGSSLISEVASRAPAAFLREVLPFITSRAEAFVRDQGAVAGRPRRRYLHVGNFGGIDNALFSGADTALRLLATAEPHAATTLAGRLCASDSTELRLLGCRTLAVLSHANEAIDWLLSDDRNLELGWADSPRCPSEELIAAATRDCDDEHLEAIAQHLLTHFPAWEKTPRGQRVRGHTQYALLSAIDPGRRSDTINRRISEWHRKFGELQPTRPAHVMASFVGPPIPQKAAPLLTDDDWIRAIRKYSTDGTDWVGESPAGGAQELAILIGTQAEVEPERFARLALTLDAQTPPAHIDHIITAITGKVQEPLLSQVCTHARRVFGEAVGRTICFAVHAVAREANDDLIRLVQACATDSDPDHESARSRAGSGDYFYGGDLVDAGLNCTRGAAARTLAHVLFAQHDRATELLPSIGLLAADRILAVRVQAAEAVIALMDRDRQAAQDLADSLFAGVPVDILESDVTARLLYYASAKEPDRFAPHLLRGLKGPSKVAEYAGMVWAALYQQNLLVHPTIPTDLGDLSADARLGATKALADAPIYAHKDLERLFNDEDPKVRAAAAESMRAVGDLEPPTAEALLAAFWPSAAYEEHFDFLFDSLDEGSQILPKSTIAACGKAIELASHQLGDVRTRHAATSSSIISVVLRLYRQGDDDTRRRCLDLIDELTLAGAYGLPEALSHER
jgi:hypothetical protein